MGRVKPRFSINCWAVSILSLYSCDIDSAALSIFIKLEADKFVFIVLSPFIIGAPDGTYLPFEYNTPRLSGVFWFCGIIGTLISKLNSPFLSVFVLYKGIGM